MTGRSYLDRTAHLKLREFPKWPIVHKMCGTTVAFFLREPKRGDVVRSEDVELLDGSHPKPGTVVVFVCPLCSKSVGLSEVTRLPKAVLS